MLPSICRQGVELLYRKQREYHGKILLQRIEGPFYLYSRSVFMKTIAKTIPIMSRGNQGKSSGINATGTRPPVPESAPVFP